MFWFEALTGFREEGPQQVRSSLVVDGESMTSRVNGRAMRCGRLEITSLGDLRVRAESVTQLSSRIRVSEVVGNVQQLHVDPENAEALFQVASQFNLLEMISPAITPEHGITGYEGDQTQGPACAISCGAGTIFRNYFVDIDGHIGQTADRQIDCLRELGQKLGNTGERLWVMRNGYALPTEEGLIEVSDTISSADDDERERLKESLQIGVHWNTEVTIEDAGHLVTQAYCSAMPVSYSKLASELWSQFASLVLEAAYEATLYAGILNAAETGSKKVFLTLLGGGAFGNSTDWILPAIASAVRKLSTADLDVMIVSYGGSNRDVRDLLLELRIARFGGHNVFS